MSKSLINFFSRKRLIKVGVPLFIVSTILIFTSLSLKRAQRDALTRMKSLSELCTEIISGDDESIEDLLKHQTQDLHTYSSRKILGRQTDELSEYLRVTGDLITKYDDKLSHSSYRSSRIEKEVAKLEKELETSSDIERRTLADCRRFSTDYDSRVEGKSGVYKGLYECKDINLGKTIVISATDDEMEERFVRVWAKYMGEEKFRVTRSNSFRSWEVTEYCRHYKTINKDENPDYLNSTIDSLKNEQINLNDYTQELMTSGRQLLSSEIQAPLVAIVKILNTAICLFSGDCETGCTDSLACNFQFHAVKDDGSCKFPAEYYDCDYNCLYDTDFDGVCDELEVQGCTDTLATNFKVDATDDDGSCVFLSEYDSYYNSIFKSNNTDENLTSDLTCIDFDNNEYKTVKIGRQVWMAENLKTTHYSNGDPILVQNSNMNWIELKESETGAYSNYPWDNDDQSTSKCKTDCSAQFGYLYNWYAVNDDRGVCPEGFHIPSKEEWIAMEIFLGLSFSEAHEKGFRGTNQGSMIAGYSEFWDEGKLSLNSAFGVSAFDALPGGFRSSATGTYHHLGSYGIFWSSTAFDNNTALNWALSKLDSGIYHGQYGKTTGCSIRCVSN